MRYHLRATELWVLAVAFGCAMGMMLSLRDWNWLGDPLWGQETIGIGQVLVLPLAAGGVAVLGWRDRGSYFSVLCRGEQARHLVHAVGTWWILLATTYLVANAVCVLASRGADVSVRDASILPLATQVMGLLLALAVGYAIGFALNSWAGALVASVLVAVTLTLDRLGTVATGLAEYAANGPMMGADPNPEYFAARAGWMVLLAMAALALLVLPRRGQRMVSGLALLTVVAGTVLFRSNDSYSFAESPSGYCAGTSIRVCGPPSLAARVREAASIAAPVAKGLDNLGVTPPSRLVAWQPAVTDQNWVELLNGSRFRDRLDPGQVTAAVASPKSCRLWSGSQPPPDEWFAADGLVRSFLEQAMHRNGGLAYQELSRRIGAENATAAVMRAAQALQSCDVTLIPAELRE